MLDAWPLPPIGNDQPAVIVLRSGEQFLDVLPVMARHIREGDNRNERLRHLGSAVVADVHLITFL